MGEHEGDRPEVSVVIDGLSYRVAAGVITGAQVRSIPHPTIGSDRDIWLEVPDGSDRFVTEDEKVELSDGIRFLTAPQRIMAGGILSTWRRTCD